ncbi:MAG: hypothetical protein GZ085_07120 [Sulfuriferula multivorans]|uniref:Transglutaminase-like domain-containing protein n=1 Tax=Sulfuriferula multivorans TaxID=1559896 RepID=A0A7C9JWV7_9PROT|nr:hypothetical protein [Sulfuriferula multivorans]
MSHCRTVCLALLLLPTLVFGSEPSNRVEKTALRTIEVVESVNPPLNPGARKLILATDISDAYHRSLRSYLKGEQDLDLSSDPAVQFRIAAWVHGHISHDSYNTALDEATTLEILQRAIGGERFSCADFSNVLKDLLGAFGFVSRVVSLQSPNIAYGSLGSGHVANEFWSNTLDKWIFVDAQWGLYARHRGRPLNFYEMAKLRQAGKFGEVEFLPVSPDTSSDPKKLKQKIREYRAFLKDYFGFLSARYRYVEQTVNMVLPLEGRSLPLTFQGLGRNGQMLITDPAEHYFSLNHTSILLYYRDQPTSGHPLSGVDTTSTDDYLARMPQFAAQPDYTVVLYSNTPWMDRYEFSVDGGAWKALEDNTVTWTLHEGINRFAARAVNHAGIAGPKSVLAIRYGSAHR